jgi:hypothetical protein
MSEASAARKSPSGVLHPLGRQIVKARATLPRSNSTPVPWGWNGL